MQPMVMSLIKYGIFAIFFCVVAFKTYQITMKFIKKYKGEKSEFDEWLE